MAHCEYHKYHMWGVTSHSETIYFKFSGVYKIFQFPWDHSATQSTCSIFWQDWPVFWNHFNQSFLSKQWSPVERDQDIVLLTSHLIIIITKQWDLNWVSLISGGDCSLKSRQGGLPRLCRIFHINLKVFSHCQRKQDKDTYYHITVV